MNYLQESQESLRDRSVLDRQDLERRLQPSEGIRVRQHTEGVEHSGRTLHLVSEAEGATTPTCWQRIRERKMCKWAVSYLAVAWLALQLMDVLGEIWAFSVPFQQTFTLLLGLAFFPVLVVAWYHGERGRQRVSGVEAAILALLATGSGLLVWVL